MAEEYIWQKRAKQFGRQIFRFRLPQIRGFDAADVSLRQPEIQAVSLQLDGNKKEPIFFPPCLKPFTLAIDRIELPLPEHYYLGGNLLIDIPGIYQFASRLFINPPSQQLQEFKFFYPGQKDFTPIEIDVWVKPTVENLFWLLTEEEKPFLETAKTFNLADQLKLNFELLYPEFNFSPPSQEAITAFQIIPQPEKDLTPQLTEPWSEINVEDALRLLEGEDGAFLHSPGLYQFTDDLYLSPAECYSPQIVFAEPEQIDLSEEGFQIWPKVVVENMFLLLVGVGCAGKDYEGKRVEVVEQVDLEVDPTKEICIHGLLKSTCAICIEREAERLSPKKRRRKGKPKPRVINPFDLLLPFLYPPLDANFDSALIFPVGKKLYDFQKIGVKFLATNKTALLADEMGLGKSIQAIFASRLLFRTSKKPMSMLIVSPKSVLKDWEKKLEEWAPEMRIILIEGQPVLRAALWHTPAHIYLAGYDTVTRDIVEIQDRKFNIVILDEIQSIKSPKTKRTKSVRKIIGEYRWGLSATPLENKVEDLVSIFAYLRPGLLTYEDAKYTTLIKAKIQLYFLRRKMKDVRKDLNLGEPIYQEVWLELTLGQQETYNRILEDATASLKPIAKQLGQFDRPTRQQNISARGHILAQISKLKQICNFDPETGQSCKANYLKDKLKQLHATGDKILIFSQYPRVSLEPLAGVLGQFGPETFDGTLSNTERDRRIREFQEQDKTPVMLMSVKAGGVGITLTRANHVFFLDQWWNPAIGKQAEGRVFRIGQEKTVFITSLYVADTIEERIRELLKRKQKLFDEIIDEQSETAYQSVTTEELLELFGLVKFDIVLTKPGREIGTTIKVVREVTGLEYSEARQLVQSCPSTLLHGISKQKAERAKLRLEEATGSIITAQPRYS